MEITKGHLSNQKEYSWEVCLFVFFNQRGMTSDEKELKLELIALSTKLGHQQSRKVVESEPYPAPTGLANQARAELRS